MRPFLIKLRINGMLYEWFKVYADSERQAGITAKIHLQAKYGVDLV